VAEYAGLHILIDNREQASVIKPGETNTRYPNGLESPILSVATPNDIRNLTILSAGHCSLILYTMRVLLCAIVEQD